MTELLDAYCCHDNNLPYRTNVMQYGIISTRKMPRYKPMIYVIIIII